MYTSCLSLVGLCVSEILDTTRIQVVYLLWAYVSLKYWILHVYKLFISCGLVCL